MAAGNPQLDFGRRGIAVLDWYHLLAPAQEKKHTEGATHTFWGAIKTNIIADAVMGLENVLAVAGAAHKSFLLMIIGLLVSVPVAVWGSTINPGWLDRFPALVYIGTGVLGWTAAKMIVDESLHEESFN
jgi:YjbE family integral membrane protein